MVGGRRSSSSAVNTPVAGGSSVAGSLPPTPVGERAGSRGGFFDFGMDVPKRQVSTRPVAGSSPYRPVSRDVSSAPSAQFVTAASSLTQPTTKSSARSPARSSLRPAQSRMSIAPSGSSRLHLTANVAADKSPGAAGSTPTHAPPSANTRGSSSAAAVAAARRRRQTSGAELGRQN